jgi:dolichol-phosphate mannosyltransferase
MPIQVKSLAEWEREGIADMLSVVIPAHNEEGHIADTVERVVAALEEAKIRHEVLVINDNSVDRTEEIVRRLARENPAVRCVASDPPNGFGFAVRRGLAEFRGDVVAIFMADGSDGPADLVAFYRELQDGYDCVFGSRFSRGGRVVDYPILKLVLNRLGNRFIQLLFRTSCDDISNAFKMYRRTVIAGIQPLLARHFNLTVELPLKSIVRGYRYAIVPNTWINRKQGVSKFQIKEMGARYFFIVLYCFLEKSLARGDFRTSPQMRESQLQVWRAGAGPPTSSSSPTSGSRR